MAQAATRTAKRPVVNEYHGVKVMDSYQWLENAADPAVRRWSDAQNKQARALLDKLPTRPWVEERLKRLLTDPSTNYYSLRWRRGTLFLLKFQPPAQQPILTALGSLTNLDSERVILDPNKLDVKGTTTIDWYVPSPDGKLVAVSLSENGSESGTLYLFETATGQRRADVISRVHGPTAGGSAAWNSDGTGIYYTRYPRPGERPEADLSFYQQVYFHALGTTTERDVYEIGKEFPRIAEIELKASSDGRRILAAVANGDGGEFAHYLREPSGQWRQITRFQDMIVQAEFGRDPLYIEAGKDAALYLLSRDHTPKGKILRLPFASSTLSNASVMVPEGTNVIRDFRPMASGLALVLMQGGPSELSFLDYSDKRIRAVGGGGPGFGGPGGFGGAAGGGPPGPGGSRERSVSSIEDIVVFQGDELWYREASYTAPYAWRRYNPSPDSEFAGPTALSGRSPADFGDVEAVRVMVASKDGVNVPLNIIRKKGTRLNGENPTLLTGYGGFGISLEPGFDTSRRVWLDQGGVIAVANLRGGGEFGEEWHRAGKLVKKQNVFDDFAACAQFLIRSNYTKPSKLAIQGGSNGGLLMGAMLTQHPDLVQAVVSHVGIYDMLRVELDPNGAFNVTEFGTVRDADQFRALHAYSPFHRVMDGTNYPAVLMLTGEHDGRVNPAHSRKMTARLQTATASQKPVLLRTSGNTGHGIGTALSERIQELADIYAFLFDQLGVDYSLVERGPWSGAVTPTSALVKAKLALEGMKARLVVSRNPLLTRRIYSDYARSESNRYNIVGFSPRKLDPDTQYYYALEAGGRLDRTKRGEFRTFPAPGPASFKFAFASCARTGSTSDVFDKIRENHPLFFLHMGDFQYLDIRTNSRPRFRAAYDSVLASPQQSEMYRHVPLAYIWDDHDFGGNNSDIRSTTHQAARLTYEEFVPHYPLVFDQEGPISQSFSVGRVKFILTDLRSQRSAATNNDDATKSMMGSRQKEWFKKELLEANGKYPLICWMSSVPWIGIQGTNVYRGLGTNDYGFIHHTNLLNRANAESFGSGTNRESFGSRTNDQALASRTNNPTTGGSTNLGRGFRGRGPGGGGPPSDEDHWSVFSTERREIADFIKSNHISGVCILHGDSHMIAADDGSNSDYATGGGAPIPVMCGAPLDQEASLKGGPYSQGVYRARRGEGCFGLLTVADRGDRIDVTYSGRNIQNEEKISLKFSVPASNHVSLLKTLAKKR